MLCPTCHSNVGTGSLDALSRMKGAQGVDDQERPVPQWTDDPLLTLGGLSGEDYANQRTHVRNAHIKEIQDVRRQQEIDAGLEPTDFSDIDDDHRVSRRHFVELRESTERILDITGQTLQDYFQLDVDDNVVAQNPSLIAYGASSPQNEWVDVNRGEQYVTKTGAVVSTFERPLSGITQSPTLPAKTHIKAVHIEDLRHPLNVGIAALLISTDFGGALYQAKKFGQVTFKNAEPCGHQEE